MTLRTDERDDVVVLTLDRAPVNALDLEMTLEMEATFDRLTERRPAAVVLTGAGRAFSAGVDTRAFAAASREDRAQQVLAITRMITALYSMPFPVVAAVNGHALGGGFVLVLACDMRLCVPDAEVKLGLTEAQAGVPFPAGPIEVMKAELAADIVRRLTLTSATLKPEAMHSLGPIDRLIDAGSLVASARSLALEMAAQPAFAVVKSQLRASTVERLRAISAAGGDPLLAFLEGREGAS